MTVKELIERLKEQDQDAVVMAFGYEDGYDSINNIKTIYTKPTGNNVWCYGDFEETFDKTQTKTWLIA